MPAPDLTAFWRRLDAYLDALPSDAARGTCLKTQLARFERDYAEFQRQCAAGTYDGAADAHHFLDTISGLDARLHQREAA